MVNEVPNEIQNQNVPPAVSGNAPVPEKMVPQSEVNDMIGKTKHNFYMKGKQDALAELQQTPTPAMQQQPTAPNAAPTGLTPEQMQQMRQVAQEEAKQQHAQMIQAAVHQKTANDFVSKLMAAKEKYPDIEEKTMQMNLHQHPEIVALTNGVDNTADVVMDLRANPMKMASLSLLAARNPQLAQDEIAKLSHSIKQNQNALAAAQAQSPNEPLSQISPSTTGTDNGKMGVRDYKSQPWLRG